MTAIDASQRLALLLRTQVSAFRAPPGPRAGRAGAPQVQGQPPDLAGVVAQRIQALAKNDPERKRKALRIFLESLLLEQLGSDLLRSTSFDALVDSVQAQMEQDREIAAAADALGEILVSEPRR